MMVNFYCLNCLSSFSTKNERESHNYLKSYKTPSIVYVDLESWIKKVDGCKNNSKTSSTKVGARRYSLQIFGAYNMDN